MTAGSVPAPTSRVRFGLARVDITPPVGIYHRMWGAARHDRATGVHRPLTAEALAFAPLEGPEPPFIRVQMDMVGLGAADYETMAGAAAEGAGVPRERVVVAFSHSHSAGFFAANRVSMPGGELIRPYLEGLREKVRQAAREAAGSLREAVITYGSGRCGMNASRDYRDEERGIYVCGFDPGGAADDTLIAGRVCGRDGKLLASVVHYACHPTTLAWDNSLISPDYVGAMRETVERDSGAPCVFALAACGDLGPRDGFTGDPATADRNGRQLGYAALSVLESLPAPETDFAYAGPVISGATIGVWEHVRHGAGRRRQTARFAAASDVVRVPLRDLPRAGELQADVARWESLRAAAEQRGDAVEARDCGARAERARRWLGRIDGLPAGSTYALGFSVLRMGDAVWVTCGGEPYSALQGELRRRFPSLALLVTPLAGEMRIAYLLPRDRYGLGLYQEEPSILAPGCLEMLADAIAERVASLLDADPR